MRVIFGLCALLLVFTLDTSALTPAEDAKVAVDAGLTAAPAGTTELQNQLRAVFSEALQKATTDAKLQNMDLDRLALLSEMMASLVSGTCGKVLLKESTASIVRDFYNALTAPRCDDSGAEAAMSQVTELVADVCATIAKCGRVTDADLLTLAGQVLTGELDTFRRQPFTPILKVPLPQASYDALHDWCMKTVECAQSAYTPLGEKQNNTLSDGILDVMMKADAQQRSVEHLLGSGTGNIKLRIMQAYSGPGHLDEVLQMNTCSH